MKLNQKLSPIRYIAEFVYGEEADRTYWLGYSKMGDNPLIHLYV